MNAPRFLPPVASNGKMIREAARIFVKAQVDVIRARKKRGPLKASWSLRMETSVLFSQRLQERLYRVRPGQQIEGLRKIMSLSLPLPMWMRKEKCLVGRINAVEFFRKSQKNSTGDLPEHAQKHLIYFHGGGYVFGTPENGIPLFAELLKKQKSPERDWQGRVLGIQYRLAPEHPWPAALEDAVAALDALADEYGAANLILAGDSAGGGLMLSAALNRRDRGEENVAGLLGISPWVLLQQSSRSYDWAQKSDSLTEKTVRYCKNWVWPFAEEIPSSLNVIHANLKDLPPLFLAIGEAELFYDDLIEFSEKAKNAGVQVEPLIGVDMPHDWPLLPFGEASEQALAALIKFIRTL